MLSYRALAQNVRNRIGLSFESTLVFISYVIKALAHHLDAEEARVFKSSIPMELRQLIADGQKGGRSEMQSLLNLIASRFDLPLPETSQRVLVVLDEMRSSASPWDDVQFLETLDRLRNEIDILNLRGVAA
jgi:hypothetical protein